MRSGGLVALVLAVAASNAAAQTISFNRPGSGARAAGMGNAFIAVADDGTAASWNPAGLSQLLKPEFSLVHTTTQRTRFREGFRARDESAVFTNLETSSSTANIEFASGAVPFRLWGKPTTLQVGWRRLYDLGEVVQGDMTRVPTSPTGREQSKININVTTSGSIDVWSVAGAVGLTDRLSVGGSVDFYRATWHERDDFNETPGTLGPTDFVSTVQDFSLSGQTLNLGVLLAYPSVSVGFVYHGRLEGDLDETFSFLSTLRDPIIQDTPPDGELRFPQSFGGGVVWRPQPVLRVALDVTYNQWTQFLVSEGQGADKVTVSGFDQLPPELSASRDTVSVNAGMEKLFSTGGAYVPLRLGVAYEPQGGRDPLLREDLNHYVLAAGTGINTNSFKFDVALEYRWGSVGASQNLTPVYQAGRSQDFGLGPPPEAQGDVRFRQWRFKVSVIYRLTNTQKLKDAMKKVFGS